MPFKYTTTFAPGGELILWELKEYVKWFYERMTLSKALEKEFRSIRADGVRLQWVASRFVLQQLARAAVLEIEKDHHGKPHFVHDTRFISLSHCQGYAAAISADVAVGIDVELVSARVQRIKSRFLSEAELALLGETDAMLMLAWSAKEAVYKMYGEKGLLFKADMSIEAVHPADNKLQLRLRKKENSVLLDVNYQFFDGLVMSWVAEATNG